MTTSPQEPDAVNLRFLRILVTVLTGTMIVGLLVIIGLIVMRFSQTATIPLPDDIDLPAGTSAQSITIAKDFYLVTTDANQVLVFDRAKGTLSKTIDLPDID